MVTTSKESKQIHSPGNNESDNSDWGWEPIDKDDSPINESFHPEQSKVTIVEESPTSIPHLRKKTSNRSIDIRNNALQMSEMSLKSGITSSPSFHELEMAIGATLAMSLNGSDGDLSQYGYASRGSFGAIVNGIPRVGSISQFNYSINQQRLNKQRMIGINGPRIYSQQPMLPKDELSEFIKESESRALILFHSPSISPVAIRDSCQKFGVLLYIRPEFHFKGVTFISYYDIRCATKAFKEISNEFKISTGTEVMIYYSFMLQAANNNSEEQKLVIKNLPNSIKESELESIFSRYGEVRSIERKTNSTDKNSNPAGLISTNVYCVEYFSIQDCRLALAELLGKSTQMFGMSVSVTFATIQPNKQELCRQLLSVLTRWKNDQSNGSSGPPIMPPGIPPPGYNRPSSTSTYFSPPPSTYSQGNYFLLRNNDISQNQPYQSNSRSMSTQAQIVQSNNHSAYNVNASQYDPNLHQRINYSTNLPNNNGQVNFNRSQNEQAYSYSQNISSHIQNQPYNLSVDLPIQSNSLHMIQQGNTNLHVSIPSPRGNSTEKDFLAYQLNNPYNRINSPSIIPQQGSPTNSSYVGESSHQIPRPQHHNNHLNIRRPTRALNSPPTDTEFIVDLGKLVNNSETRTTIMVRNIPNKYTQRMLLEEVDLNNKGTYDFFYLPIDFKNKCNVGYCFINFLEPRFILQFMEEFNNQRWKNFNSEKICAVTFARIQGRQAMITRFQNSSLLEKNDEYRPLLFYSSGPDRGKPEPFPSGTRQYKAIINGGSGYQSSGSAGSGHKSVVYGVDSVSRSASTDQYDEMGSLVSDKDSQRFHSSIDDHDLLA